MITKVLLGAAVAVGIYAVAVTGYMAFFANGFTGVWSRVDDNSRMLTISSTKAVSVYGGGGFSSSGTIEVLNPGSARVQLSGGFFGGSETLPLTLNGDELVLQENGNQFVYHRCTQNCPPPT